jgi:hypothetical protein
LKAGEIRKLPHPNGIEGEVDAQRLQRAVGPSRGIHPVTLVERGPLPERLEAKDPAWNYRGVIADTKDPLSGCARGE